MFKKLNYNYVYGKTLNKEPQQFFLTEILKTKIKELNPWLTDTNLNKIIREITLIQATSDIEANKTFYYKLVNYTSIKQDKGYGKKSQTVKIIDFENIENNDFTVINQFSIKNKENKIIPDIVIFVNGIPIAIIECKSPNVTYPTNKAINQLIGYKQSNEQFFYPNQFLITLARYQAKFSTTYSDAKYFFDWKVPYPKEIEEIVEKPTKQDILIYSIFRKENLLDLIQNYIVFEETDNKLLKKLSRYNQYIASNKILQRIKTEQGGVIWHTQGSGKSLTMTFTAQKIRRIQKIKDTKIENPCILIVTDRTDLDDQISTTFKNCDFPNPIQIDSIKQLNDELKNPTGKTLFTTISTSESRSIFSDLLH